MERINVSKEFRVCKSNCNFKMKFGKKVDMLKVYKTMEAVVNEISNGAEYSKLWLQDLADGSGKDSFIIEYSTLFSHEFNEYVPAMCKAVAQALPDVDFDAYALYDDHKCCWVDEFEVSFTCSFLYVLK